MLLIMLSFQRFIQARNFERKLVFARQKSRDDPLDVIQIEYFRRV